MSGAPFYLRTFTGSSSLLALQPMQLSSSSTHRKYNSSNYLKPDLQEYKKLGGRKWTWKVFNGPASDEIADGWNVSGCGYVPHCFLVFPNLFWPAIWINWTGRLVGGELKEHNLREVSKKFSYIRLYLVVLSGDVHFWACALAPLLLRSTWTTATYGGGAHLIREWFNNWRPPLLSIAL